MRRLAMLLCALLLLPSLAAAQGQPVKLKVGMVAAVDMLALPIAVERGFFEKQGLDVTLARPYATGVDALNALQAGETDMVQAGVPRSARSCAAWTSCSSAISAVTPPSSVRMRRSR
jgi:sulfonate transport system substrate-binding protein